MIPMGIVALAYVMPIIRKNANKIRIREIGLWKIFLIAIIWSGMTVFLPAVHVNGFEQLSQPISWQLALERTVFILAITIPFDIRDLINDAKKKVRTIPSVLGWKKSILLSIGLLVAFWALVHLRIGIHNPLLIGYGIATAITILVVALSSPKRNDMYCSFWLEGTMFFQFMVLLVMS